MKMPDKNAPPGWLKQDGILAWANCFSAFITLALCSGIDYSFGEAIGDIMKELDVTASTAACDAKRKGEAAQECTGLALDGVW